MSIEALRRRRSWVTGHQLLLREPAHDAWRNNQQFVQLHGWEIEVIEVYNGVAPDPGSDAACGVIAVWLRRDLDGTATARRR